MAPELITLCQTMLKEGKTISVGLLKAKAPKNYPLKEIINAVQYCKTQPDLVLQQDVPNRPVVKDQSVNETQELASLHVKVSEMEKRLANVEQQLAQLTK